MPIIQSKNDQQHKIENMTKKKGRTDEDLDLDSFLTNWDLIRSAAPENDEILTDTELYLPSLQGGANDAIEAPDDHRYDIDMEEV